MWPAVGVSSYVIGIQKTAKTMRDKGFDLETITSVTGLSKNDIENL